MVDGRIVRRNLEDGCHSLEFVPRRIASQHLHHRAAKAPGKTANGSLETVPPWGIGALRASSIQGQRDERRTKGSSYLTTAQPLRTAHTKTRHMHTP